MSEYEVINKRKETMELDPSKPMIAQLSAKYVKEIKNINQTRPNTSIMLQFQIDLANKFVEENKDKNLEELQTLVPSLVSVVKAVLDATVSD